MAKRKVKKTAWKAEVPAITKANECLIPTEVTITPKEQELFNTIMLGIHNGDIKRITDSSPIHPDQKEYYALGFVEFYIRIPELKKMSKIESEETFMNAFEKVRTTAIRCLGINKNTKKIIAKIGSAVFDVSSIRGDMLCFGFSNFMKDIIEKLGGNDYNILIYNKEEDEID